MQCRRTSATIAAGPETCTPVSATMYAPMQAVQQVMMIIFTSTSRWTIRWQLVTYMRGLSNSTAPVMR